MAAPLVSSMGTAGSGETTAGSASTALVAVGLMLPSSREQFFFFSLTKTSE